MPTLNKKEIEADWEKKVDDEHIVYNFYPFTFGSRVSDNILGWWLNKMKAKESQDLNEIIEWVEGSFEHLERVKKCWDDILELGEPNEITKTQIFGFMQAYEISKENLNQFVAHLTSLKEKIK